MPELEVSVISIIKRVGKWIVVCLYSVTEVFVSEALDETGQLSSEFHNMASPEKCVREADFLTSQTGIPRRSARWMR